jgi:hypothetical protein
LVALVNKGRRLVSVRDVGLRLHSGKLLRSADLIRPLVLGDRVGSVVSLYEYGGPSSPLDVSRAEAWDTTGRRYASVGASVPDNQGVDKRDRLA